MAKRVDFHPSDFGPLEIRKRGAEPLELSLQISRPPSIHPYCPRALLVAGISNGEELWALRQHDSSGLYLYHGNEGAIYLGLGPAPGEALSLGISYNPMTGAISVAADKKVWTGRARCSWAQPDQERADWELWLGCPLNGGTDHPPIGWKFEGTIKTTLAVPCAPKMVMGHKAFGLKYGLAELLDQAKPPLASVPAEEIRSVLRELGIDDLTTDEEEEEIEMHWDAVVTIGAVAAQEIPADAAIISKFAAEMLEEHLKWAAARRGRS